MATIATVLASSPDNTASSSTRNSRSSRGRRNFGRFSGRDMPGALLPKKPDGGSWYSTEALGVLRLSSKNHCDVAMRVGDKVIHILASHPTPPAFDGPRGPRRALRGPRRPSTRSRDDGPGGCGGGARAPRGSVPAPRRGRDRPGSTSLLRLLATAGTSPTRRAAARSGHRSCRSRCRRNRCPSRCRPSRSSPASLTLPGAARPLPFPEVGRAPGLGLTGAEPFAGTALVGASCGSSTSITGASTTSPLVACAASTRLGFWPGLGARRSRCSAAWARRSSSSRAMRPYTFTTAGSSVQELFASQ